MGNPTMHRLFFPLLGLLLLGSALPAQNYFPYIENYPNPDKLRHTEATGAVVQGEDGLVYVGYPNGVLVFLGGKIAMVPTNAPVTALATSRDGKRIYVGLKKGFGYVERRGKSYEYYSLSDKFEAETVKKSGPVSEIYLVNDEVVFASRKTIFAWDEPRQKGRKPVSIAPFEFRGSVRINDLLFFNTSHKGILEYFQGKARYPEEHQNDLFEDKEIIFQTRYADGVALIVLSDHSVHLCPNTLGVTEPLLTQQEAENFGKINGVFELSDNYLLTTENNGSFFVQIHRGGESNTIETLGILNSLIGLSENTILNVSFSADQELWLTHPNSLSLVNFQLPISSFRPLESNVNDLQEYGGRLYAATDAGLFYLRSDPDRTIVERLERWLSSDESIIRTLQSEVVGWWFKRYRALKPIRCNQLINLNGSLHVATAIGIFRVEGSNAQRLTSTGANHFARDPNSGYLYVASGRQILVYVPGDEGWKKVGELVMQRNDFGRINKLDFDNTGTLWVATETELYYLKNAPISTPRRKYGRIIGEANLFRSGKYLYGLVNGDVYSLKDSTASKINNGLGMDRSEDAITMAGNNENTWLFTGSLLRRAKRVGLELRPEAQTKILGILPETDLMHFDQQSGNLWLVSGKQVFKFIEPNKFPPLPRKELFLDFRSIMLSGKPLIWPYIADSNVMSQELDLPYGSSYEIAFQLQAPQLHQDSEIYFEWWVNGEKKRPRRDPNFIYNIPGSGEYEVKIVAVDEMGNRSEPLLYSFSMATHPLLRWYLWPVYILVIGGPIWWYNRYRERKLRRRNQELEQAVDEATKDLQQKNKELEESKERIQAQQSQLIQSEKMAIVGQMVTRVAHEVNTPLGAINGAIHNIQEILPQALGDLPAELKKLDPKQREQAEQLRQIARSNTDVFSTREERQIKNQLELSLENHGIYDADRLARELFKIGIYDQPERFIELLSANNAMQVLEGIGAIAGVKGNLQRASNSVTEAQKLVMALKRNSHQGIGLEEEDFERANLIESIEEKLPLYNSQFQSGIELKKEYNANPEVPLLPTSIGSVWNNIIMNAIQAMRGQGKLEISVDNFGEYAKVTFTDSGPGIPPEIQERVFDHLFTTKPKGEGTGMGLPIVKDIIKRHGGTIELHSEPGRTTFVILLPKAPPAPTA